MGTEYTKIPDEFIDNYEDWFDVKIITEKYKDSKNPILAACEDHPVYFAYFKLGFKLRDYQVYHLDMMKKHRFVMSLMARRSGKSTDQKVFGAWALNYNKYPKGLDRSTKIVVIAHVQDEAESYIEEINMMFQEGDERVKRVFKGQLGDKYFTSRLPTRKDKAKNNNTQFSIFGNGKWNTIRVFAPTPKARGKGASIIFMDELAFWRDYANGSNDEYKIYKEAVRPIITDDNKSKVFCATTPNGTSGLYYDLMPVDDHKTRFKLVWMPYYYRKDQEYLDEIKETRREYEEKGWGDSFRQEYLSELVSKRKAYFHKENEVDKIFRGDHSFRTQYSGEAYAAIDFGGSTTSRSVITVVKYDKANNRYIRLYHKRYPVGGDSELMADILDISRRFPNIIKWYVDSQGGGSAFYSWFKKKGFNYKEVVFRGQKADFYRLFKQACFQYRIKSYYDPDLQEEFLNFTGDLKPEKGYTDDMIDSFVMACMEHLEIKSKTKLTIITY